ncbi:aspartokinase [Photobacterium aphoticum]|nr:aspartokinase [Photobacterium aphoticum]
MKADITPLALHSSMRNVNVQFVVSDNEYQGAICALHDEFFDADEKADSKSKVA